MKLREDETVLHERQPKAAILTIRLFSKCLPYGILGAVMGFVACMISFSMARAPGGSMALAFGVSIAAALGLMALPFVYAVFLRRTDFYWITNLQCVFRGGILKRVERSVPYHKITDVETTQNIVERLLGTPALIIYTPGTASGPGTYAGQGAELRFIGLGDSETPDETINKQLRSFRATGE